MLTRTTIAEGIWIDIENPSENEVHQIVGEFALHPLVHDALERPIYHSYIERYGEHLLLVVHTPTIDQRGDVKFRELDILIGKNVLITKRIRPYAHFDELREALTRGVHGTEKPITNIGNLLYVILDRIFDDIFAIIDSTENAIENIEDALFAGKETEMVPKISLLHRNVVDLRRAIGPAALTLEALLGHSGEFVANGSRMYLKDVIASSQRANDIVNSLRETIAALEQTNQALLSTKINQIVRVLTIFTASALPFTVISSMYGMNIILPSSGASNLGDFAMLFGLMFAVSGSMIAVFKMKKWI